MSMKAASSRENWVTARSQRGHEGEEESVVSLPVSGTYIFQEGAGFRMPEWCQVVKRGAEQPGEC